MQIHTYTNTDFTGEYCEVKALFLEVEKFLEDLQDSDVQPQFLAASLRTRVHLRVAVSAPHPDTEDEFREYVQRMSLPLITAGVLIGSAGDTWKVQADTKLSMFKTAYDCSRSCLGHVLVGMNLSPRGRTEHFERLSRIPSY